jgi:nicotinamidase-related amidase
MIYGLNKKEGKMKKALLIIDVQKSAVTRPDLAKKIEALQANYENIFVSFFKNEGSPLLKLLDWTGYEDESPAFQPVKNAVIFTKNGYSSYLPEMKKFDEIHLCGFDTDACVYKTAMDLMENNTRPIVLKEYCFSKNEQFHQMGIKLIERNIGAGNIR